MAADSLKTPDSTADLLGLPEDIKQRVEEVLQQVNPDGLNIAEDPAVVKAFEIIEGLDFPKDKLIAHVQNSLLNILAGMPENYLG